MASLRSLALVSLLCLTRPLAAQSSTVHHVTVDGRDRSYIVDMPRQVDARRLPVVLVFHGGGGNGEQVRQQTGMTALGLREGFITVYPNGSARIGNLLTWNTGSCCGYARKAGIDEVAFVRAILDSVAAAHPVDAARVYATGLSNGGMMSYLLACRLADRIAAIGVVSGELSTQTCTPSRPVSVLAIHGTADENLPYDGGVGRKALDPHTVRGVASAIDFWRTADRCTGTPQINDGPRFTHARSPRCAAGTAVELYTIKGGGHSWPGSTRTRRRQDEPSDAMNASETVWRFFAAHPRR